MNSSIGLTVAGMGAGLLGATIKAGYDHWRHSVVASVDAPHKEIAITTAAADAIAKAAGAVVIMLQNQLTDNATRLDDVTERLVTVTESLETLQELETQCQTRVLELERQVAAHG